MRSSDDGRRWSGRLGALLLVAAGGCGGVDESKFSQTPGTVPADAPKTPAEYDAKYPVPNAGDAASSKSAKGLTTP